MQTPSRTTPPPLAPVIDPYAPKWPKILGIFSVVIGILSFLSALMRVTSAYVQKIQMENMVKRDQADAEAVSAFLAESIPLLTVSGIILAVIAILLLIGGIMILKHRKISALLIRLWAVFYLVTGIAIVAKSYPLVHQQVKIVLGSAMIENEDGDLGMAFAMKGAEITAQIELAVSLGWVLISSLFCLIWFGRQKIRNELKDWD